MNPLSAIHSCTVTCISCFVFCFIFGMHVCSCHNHDEKSPLNSKRRARSNSNVLKNDEILIKKIFKKYGQEDSISFESFKLLLANIGLSHSNTSDFNEVNRFYDKLSGDDHLDHNHDPHDDPVHDSADHKLDDDHGYKDDPHENKDDPHENKDDPHGHKHEHRHENHENNDNYDKIASTEHPITDDITTHAYNDYQISTNNYDLKKNIKKRRSKRFAAANDNKIEKCLQAEEYYDYNNIKKKKDLIVKEFLQICPTLIYQLDSHACHSYHEQSPNHHQKTIFKRNWALLWLYATISVFIISLVGLLGVAVIPIMEKVFYNQFLQLLVALAVGTLSGDALLHLIPHAMLSIISPGHNHETVHHHDEKADRSHMQCIWYGLVVLCGIYIFYLVESILCLIQDRKQRRHGTCNKKKKGDESKSFEKLPISINVVTNNHQESALSDGSMLVTENGVTGVENVQLASHCHDHLLHHDNESLKEEQLTHEHPDDLDHGHRHGHAHGHSHTHEVPSSVAAVAWMVIMGDGLHNFCDGLAIGAAFGDGVSSGLSTTIAVLCHELPHELGDFAVLLRAGMKIKEALLYNIVSSFLCLLGMIIGLSVGHLENVSFWVFSLTGGMFIYIALVDMLPEMRSIKKGENPFIQLLVQNLGLILGVGIMLTIAVYEDKIFIEIP